MKLVKIFGVVMGVHAAVFMFIFAIPGCRSTSKKPVAASPVVGAETSPLTAADTSTPVSAPAPAAEVASVRFSPTRPGSPVAAEVTAPAASAPAAPASYSVAKGDNLWTIAKKNNVTVKQLMAANNLRSDSTLHLGQKLVIPGKATTTAAAPAAPAAASVPAALPTPATAPAAPITHVVKAGETIGVIAKKYQVKVGDIATANNIADPTKIRVGQTLKIPATHSAAAKASAAGTKSAATPATPKSSLAPKPAPVTPTTSAPAAPAPVFTSPLLESAPASTSPAGESPLITPAPAPADAPIIRVEDAGATKTE